MQSAKIPYASSSETDVAEATPSAKHPSPSRYPSIKALWHSRDQLSASSGIRLSSQPLPNQCPKSTERSVLEHATSHKFLSGRRNMVAGLPKSSSRMRITLLARVSSSCASKLHLMPPL